MKHLILITFFFFLTVSVLAQETKIEHNTEYHSIKLKAKDKQFLALKDTAQKHLQEFITALKLHGSDPNHYSFSIKSDFVDKDQHEHMWSQVFLLKDENFEGIFIDSPFTVKIVKTGDKVTIKKEDVEDWIIDDLTTGQETGYFSKKYLNSKG